MIETSDSANAAAEPSLRATSDASPYSSSLRTEEQPLSSVNDNTISANAHEIFFGGKSHLLQHFCKIRFSISLFCSYDLVSVSKKLETLHS